MKKLLLIVPLALLFTSCGSKEFSQGKYDDMSEERLLDDKFNETDMRMIADTMIKSLTESAVIAAYSR